MFFSSKFTITFRVIVDIDHEIEKMQHPVKSANEHIEKYRLELMADHLSRQTKIWEFTIKNKQPKHKNAPDTMKAHFNIGNSKQNEYGTPISLEKPLHFILGDSRQNSSMESNSSYHSLSPVPPFRSNSDKENVQIIPNTKIVQNINNEIKTLKNKTESRVVTQTNGNVKTNEVVKINETMKTNGTIKINDTIKTNESAKTNEEKVKTNETVKTNEERVKTNEERVKTNEGRVKTNEEILQKTTANQCNNMNSLVSAEKQMISLVLPNFAVGQPASVIIQENLSLLHE